MKRPSYIADLVVGGLGLSVVLMLVIVLHGCGHGASRTSDVPAATEATRIRTEVPPAAKEEQDLGAQRHAAEIKAAQAKADGDTAEAYKQNILAEELGRLEGAAAQRKAEQQKQLDGMAAAADARAVAERKEIADEKAAADRAADIRTWNWLGGIVCASGVFIGVALSWLISPKLGAPLGAAAIITGLSMAAYGQDSPWLGIVGAVIVVGGAVAWLWGHRFFTGVVTDAKEAVVGITCERDHVVSKLGDLHDAVAGIGVGTVTDALAAAAVTLGRVGPGSPAAPDPVTPPIK